MYLLFAAQIHAQSIHSQVNLYHVPNTPGERGRVIFSIVPKAHKPEARKERNKKLKIFEPVGY